MRVALLTREYPPDVYGGAGVHVEYLARELARLEDVTVHKWGHAIREEHGGPTVVGHQPWEALEGGGAHLSALRGMSTAPPTTTAAEGAEVAHSHTWYANLAGHLSGLTYDIPHVATVHSLEPLRPWKAEQLGGGYALSSWCERVALEGADAVIAVSQGMRADVLAAYPGVSEDRIEVVYNGIDTEEYRPDPEADVLERIGVDPARPSVVFVGRITRQKGVPYLLQAARSLSGDAQLVLCAGAPDTPELGAEVARLVDELRATRDGVFWIDVMLPKRDVIQLLSHATVFACPSIYEPLGIVNLEAMACEAAVVASAVGGIPEVVVDGETGLLVPFSSAGDGSPEPADPDAFVAGLAERLNALVEDPARAAEMGRAGRARAVDAFAWGAIAEQTAAVYRRLASG
jgi:alpha-maltose-1-phosphate synthase